MKRGRVRDLISRQSQTVTTSAEQAWNTLPLVDGWLRHAEAKLGIALAATGVSEGMLFNLVKEQKHPSLVFTIVAGLCCAAILAAGACGVVELFPVVRLPQKAPTAPNPLFFHDIATKFEGNQARYVETVRASDQDELTAHLGQQISANAAIGTRKYRWANTALQALLITVVILAVVAIIAVLGW